MFLYLIQDSYLDNLLIVNEFLEIKQVRDVAANRLLEENEEVHEKEYIRVLLSHD